MTCHPLVPRPASYPAPPPPPPPATFTDLQRCGQAMNPPCKGGRGMSTNGKACYDKLDKAIVALSWLDDCTQSISLRAFFSLFTWPEIQSHPFIAGPGEPLTPRPTITHHPPSPSLPCPLHPHPYQRLSVICGQMICDFEGGKNEEKKRKE